MSINGPNSPILPGGTPRAAARVSTAATERNTASAAERATESREKVERASGIAATNNENSRPHDRSPDGRQAWRRMLRLLGLGGASDKDSDDNEPPAPEDERLDLLG